MVRKLLIAAGLASACIGAGAQAQNQPSADAMALARALAPDRALILQVGTERQIRDEIEMQLLTTRHAPLGAPCDRSVPACRAVAHQIASRDAPRLFAIRRAAVERIYARHFDGVMSIWEIRAARSFVSQSAGRNFFNAIAALSAIHIDESSNALLEAAMREWGGLNVDSTLLNEFYDRTRDLPRARIPVAPPPPR